MLGNSSGYALSLLHAKHQGRVSYPVVAHTNHLRFTVLGGRQQLLNGGVADQCAHATIEGAWRTAALNVAEDSHACILTKPLLQHLPHLVARDRLAFLVARPFGDNDNAVTVTGRPTTAQTLAHLLLPVVWRRAFRDQDIVRTAGDRAHQGQIATVAAHHLDHECTLVAGGRAANGVNGLDDPVQRCIGADGHVGANHVVIDRADQAHDHELRVSG